MIASGLESGIASGSYSIFVNRLSKYRVYFGVGGLEAEAEAEVKAEAKTGLEVGRLLAKSITNARVPVPEYRLRSPVNPPYPRP